MFPHLYWKPLSFSFSLSFPICLVPTLIYPFTTLSFHGGEGGGKYIWILSFWGWFWGDGDGDGGWGGFS